VTNSLRSRLASPRQFAEHLTQQAIENLNSLIASSEERREESIRNMWTSLSKTMNSSVAMFVEARTSANKLRMEKLIETQSSNEKLKEELKTLLDKVSAVPRPAAPLPATPTTSLTLPFLCICRKVG